METFEDRLQRFLTGSPNEIFFTILNSLHNSVVSHEIAVALESKLYTLATLGSHAVMQTVGEQIYGLQGQDATEHFLREFVDATYPGAEYSAIAAEIHALRNVVAHQWSSARQHSIVLDSRLPNGWERRGRDLHFNMERFLTCFIGSFRAGGPMWELPQAMSEAVAKVRKYHYLCRWLELDRGDEIAKAIRGLADDHADLDARIGAIDGLLRERFGLCEESS